MSDQTPAAPVSPTGDPVLPPALVRWLLPIYFVLSGSGFGLLLELDVSQRGLAIYTFAVAILGGLLGQASPGMRRAGKAVLVAALALGLSGCATVQPFARKTLDCASPAIRQRALDAVPAVMDALGGSTSGWSDALDRVILAAGDVGICAVRVAIAELTDRPSAPFSATGAMLQVDRSELALSRAHKYLAANGVAP